MQLEDIKELVKNARNATQSADFLQLIDNFEVFSSLLDRLPEEKENPEFQLRLRDAHSRFWDSFTTVATQFGFTPESLQEHFNNPANFSEEQWAQIQSIKQKAIEGQFPRGVVKHSKKNKQRVRI